MGKRLLFGSESRDRMLEGILLLERAVISTLGPRGRNVCFDRRTSHPVITKDGVSVAREIKFSDPYMNTGASMIKEAAENTNAVAGDGTTTTVLLSSEMCKAGVKLVAAGKQPTELQKGMDAACADLIEKIDNYKMSVRSDKDILSIATISANNDPVVGSVVHQAFSMIGEGGIVDLQDSHTKSKETTIEFTDGLEFPRGIEDGRFATDKRTEKFELENANILILGFSPVLEDLKDILNYCIAKGRNIVMIAPEYDEAVVSMCVNMVVTRQCKFACIGAPGVGAYNQEEQLKDLAVMLGTKVVEHPDDIKDFVTEMKKIEDQKDAGPFGRCERISSSKFKTILQGGAGDDDAIQARANEIEEEIKKGQADKNLGISEEEISVMRKRIARLTGGMATIYVGGLSATRIKELRDRYEDAIHAVQAAISDGIVPGGGCTLLKAARDLRNEVREYPNDSFSAGYEMMLDICRVPATLIIQSVSTDYAYIISDIEHNDKKEYGYDAKAERIEKDMFKAGIIDPVKVEKTALAYSTSVAGIFITTECIITDELENISLTANDEISERTDFNYGDIQ